ncbi:MAG TPA: hypothetical protein VN888_17125, partial [Mycobacterium sp.]|nr:hypothetical protein [Mycobacterium sp.]
MALLQLETSADLLSKAPGNKCGNSAGQLRLQVVGQRPSGPDEHDLISRPGAARTTETKRMKPTQRESYHHGDLRKALLEAALELVRL